MLFARALLALACVAPLLAAHAHAHAPVGSLATHGQLLCTTALTGRITRFELTLPVKWVLVTSGAFDVNIDNMCGRQGKNLLGQLIKVCDIYPPVVSVKPWPNYTPAAVTRRLLDGKPSQVSVHVSQYCDDT